METPTPPPDSSSSSTRTSSTFCLDQSTQNQNTKRKTNDNKEIYFYDINRIPLHLNKHHQHQKLKQRRIADNQLGQPLHHHNPHDTDSNGLNYHRRVKNTKHSSDKQNYKPKTDRLPVTHDNLLRYT